MTEVFSHALLVEDEPNLSTTLKIALRKMGISCTHVSTIAQARDAVKQREPDFLLLDRGLPDGDGLEFCADLRREKFKGGIMILTAAGDTADRVDGLNQGADDYLPKPFSWDELEARIRALARRFQILQEVAANLPAEPSLKVVSTAAEPALWTIDHDRLRVFGHRGWIELTPLEFKLASRLIEANGTILTREDLLKNVWGFKFLPKTRTVDHFMGRLRKNFELDPEQPRHFLTVRGAGYRFESNPA